MKPTIVFFKVINSFDYLLTLALIKTWTRIKKSVTEFALKFKQNLIVDFAKYLIKYFQVSVSYKQYLVNKKSPLKIENLIIMFYVNYHIIYCLYIYQRDWQPFLNFARLVNHIIILKLNWLLIEPTKVSTYAMKTVSFETYLYDTNNINYVPFVISEGLS